jgi:hypothetical protein
VLLAIELCINSTARLAIAPPARAGMKPGSGRGKSLGACLGRTEQKKKSQNDETNSQHEHSPQKGYANKRKQCQIEKR